MYIYIYISYLTRHVFSSCWSLQSVYAKIHLLSYSQNPAHQYRFVHKHTSPSSGTLYRLLVQYPN